MIKIPYGRQFIDEDDIKAINEVLKSDYLTQGKMVEEFEHAVSAHCLVNYGVAVNSATSALHIACLALGVAKGDAVWTSPNTFVATANSALYCGASIDFVDIDPLTYNICPNKLEEKLRRAHNKGLLPKVVIPVHFAGQSCDMKAIHSLSLRFGFKIIEDASHAIGGGYMGEPIGCCKYSDISVFSFHPVKIITTGEGGMAVTNNFSVAEKMRQLRTHGIIRQDFQEKFVINDEIWNYQQVSLGYNFRMTEIQAALGLSQLKKISYFINAREKIAKKYNHSFEGLPVTLPFQNENSSSSYHLYAIRVNRKKAQKTQKDIYEGFIKKGIYVNLHYIPVYLQPFYRAAGFERGYCKEAERYFREEISLPIYPSLAEVEQDYVIDVLKGLLLK